MNKVINILRLSFIFYLIIVSCSMTFMNFAFGEDKKMKRKIDLISEYSLDDVDKIIIEVRKNDIESNQHIVIQNQKSIKFMVAELENIKDAGGGIGIWCNYRVLFYKGNKELLALRLFIDSRHPNESFIRYSTDVFVGEYLISRAYHDFFISILTEKLESNGVRSSRQGCDPAGE